MYHFSAPEKKQKSLSLSIANKKLDGKLNHGESKAIVGYLKKTKTKTKNLPSKKYKKLSKDLHRNK